MRDEISRRVALSIGGATAAALVGVEVAGERPPATAPASAPDRWTYERWEAAGFRYWEVVSGSAFVPCAVTLDYADLTAGPSYPWHNVLLGKEFNYPTFIDSMGFDIPLPIEPAIVPPVYTLRQADSDLLFVGYSIGNLFFAWMDVYVDPRELAPGSGQKLRDNTRDKGQGAAKSSVNPKVFAIPTPPNEVEFWLSLHKPERTAEFQRHWREDPVDRPIIGPHISLKPSDRPRFFEREPKD